MSNSVFYKGHGPVAIYRMHVALLRLLESKEDSLSEELYQDMYAKLLQLGREKIVELHGNLKAGKTDAVLKFLRKGHSSENSKRAGELEVIRRARRSRLRRALKGSSN